CPKFFPAKDLPRWIVRSIDDDGLGIVIEGSREFSFIERPVGPSELYVARSGARDNGVRTIVFVERFENDNLVTRIDDCEQHIDHGFGRAARDGDLALRIDIDAKKLLRLVD